MSTEKVPTKWFLYVRKSTDAEDRQVLSIESQIDEMKKRAKESGLRIVDVITESRSAKAPGRPLFNKMIDRVKNGEADGILCWKLDRLARNPVDGGKISWMIQCYEIKEIRTFEKSYYPTDNVLMMSVEFGMANQYLRELSANVKRGLKTKAEKGWYAGVAPAGYLNVPDRENGMQIIIRDPERFLVIREMWNLMLTGNYTVPQVWKIANGELGYKTVKRHKVGGTPISRSGLYKIFTNIFYYGYFEYPVGSGNLQKGAHEPMVTEEEYDRVQEILGRKGKPRPKSHQFTFTGMMRCGNCGSAITAEKKIKRQQNGNIHHYVYYHCTHRKDESCSEKSIELKMLNEQIVNQLKNITISENFKNWAIKYLNEIRVGEAETQEVVLKKKHKELETTVKQLDSLIVKYTSPENLENSLITQEEYQLLKSQLLKRKSDLEANLKAQGKVIEEWVELSEKTFNFACYAGVWFEKGDDQTKKAILSSLGSNLLVKDQKLNIVLHSCFQSINNNKHAVEKELVSARTSLTSMNKKKNAALGDTLPRLLGDKDFRLSRSPSLATSLSGFA